MKAFGIIGANFGDEGKGMTTAFLASQFSNSLTVRSAGGAQTSHTVEYNGNRHAFRHVSSGTWFGSDSYLSSFFITNPIVFCKENNKISRKTKVFVHPESRLTLPFDMMVNQELEIARGGSRHGSCGMGINETVIRCGTEYATKVSDISIPGFVSKLKYIRDNYHVKRFAELGLEIPACFYDDGIIGTFANECFQFIQATSFADDSILNKYETVLFEGNQGLLLDEDHHFFPHVTRSKTGSINASEILKNISVDEMEVFYCTRTYLTRHGAGPLPFETDGKIYENIQDATNIPNDFQGSIRFAPINLDLLKESIQNDIAKSSVKIIPSLAVSCVDQLPINCEYVENGELKKCKSYELLEKLSNLLNFNRTIHHNGADIKESYFF